MPMSSGKDGGGKQILNAVLAHQRDHHQRHGAGRSRDHARAATGDGGDDGDAERGIQTYLWVDAGDDGKRDCLRNQG